MRKVDFSDSERFFLILKSQLQITAQYSTFHSGPFQLFLHLRSQFLRQQPWSVVHPEIRYGFAHSQLHAAESLFRRKRQPLAQRARPGIMQPDPDIHILSSC